MQVDNNYDIIIAGAGLSGLSLTWYLIQGGYKGNILLTDTTFAPLNDKTWCFWSDHEPPFTQLVYKQWKKAGVNILDFKKTKGLDDYTYYCIKSGYFKETLLSHLKRFSNVTLLEESIMDFSSNNSKAVMVTNSGKTYLSDYIFQSILNPPALKREHIKYPLIQHFKGIEITSNKEVFDEDSFTLMHVDESYDHGLAFMYILPWSSHKALMEYTIFSEKPEEKSLYDEKIQAFLKDELHLKPEDYVCGRQEYGEIPMEIRPYHPYYRNKRVINMGTVAGLTKPSTGYTFMRIQKYCIQLAEDIIKNKASLPLPTQSAFRYRYYDRLLLHTLSNSVSKSREVFRDLFKNNSLDLVFRFLSEDSNLKQDFKIMSSVPYIPFFKAILHNLNINPAKE